MGTLVVRALLGTLAFCFSFSPATAFAEEAPPSSPPDGVSLDKLGDCAWQVSYRGHIYDLSPLTRPSLSRPVENDIRYVLQRVPEASAQLETMRGHLQEAKTQTILASLFLGGFLVAKLFEKHAAKNDTDRENFHVGEAAAAGFFVGATLFSWRSSVQAKSDLVSAVEAFNAHSASKIEPASTTAPAAGRSLFDSPTLSEPGRSGAAPGAKTVEPK